MLTVLFATAISIAALAAPVLVDFFSRNERGGDWVFAALFNRRSA